MTNNEIKAEEIAFDAEMEARDDELHALYCEEVEPVAGRYLSFEEWKRQQAEKALTLPAPEWDVCADADIPF